MAKKYRRPGGPAQSDSSSFSTRRATRQTPVLPPVPPLTSLAKVAQAPAKAGPAAVPNGEPPIPTTTTFPSVTAPPTSQTPVPIPAIPGQRGRPRARQHAAVAVETPVPIPAIPPLSPRLTLGPQDVDSEAKRPVRGGMSSAIHQETPRRSNLVAPDIMYCVPQPPQPVSVQSSLLRHFESSTLPSQLNRRPAPITVTPVLPPKPPTLNVNDRGPPRPDRNIDKVVFGDLCFRTWYPSYYGKEVLGDASGNTKGSGGSKDGSQDANARASKRDKDTQPMLERLYVCPCCFKYAKELVAWHGHVRLCEGKKHVPGRKIYTHPRGRRKVLVASDGKAPGGKRRRGDLGARYTEEYVEDEGEWAIWEVDGEKDSLFCQNLSLFAKLFLDNKSVFFDVAGFKYFLLVYTPPAKHSISEEGLPRDRPCITGFFSKEKMSWDHNNLACILIFPPWQRKGLGALLMGVSYEISRREGILGGPEKPISDLGKKGYKRFWTGEIARWLLNLDVAAHLPEHAVSGASAIRELIVVVNDCSQGTWIAVEDCVAVLRDMGVVEDAGLGLGKPTNNLANGDGTGTFDGRPGSPGCPMELDRDASSTTTFDKLPSEPQEMKLVRRVRIDKEAIRRYVATHRISLERACDASGFVENYATRADSGEAC